MCNDYKNQDSKNVDINVKIISFKFSWTGRLYNEFNHDWKIIPLNYMSNSNVTSKNCEFHSIFLSMPNKTSNFMPNKTINCGTMV